MVIIDICLSAVVRRAAARLSLLKGLLVKSFYVVSAEINIHNANRTPDKTGCQSQSRDTADVKNCLFGNILG